MRRGLRELFQELPGDAGQDSERRNRDEIPRWFRNFPPSFRSAPQVQLSASGRFGRLFVCARKRSKAAKVSALT
jgi:hypothetical protein